MGRYTEIDTDLLLLAAEDTDHSREEARERIRKLSPEERRDLRAAMQRLDTLLVEQIREASRKVLSDEEAANLAEELFGAAEVEPYTEEADELAGVVMRIINLLTYQASMSDRESNANFLGMAIYARTADCSRKMSEFVKAAGVTSREASA